MNKYQYLSMSLFVSSILVLLSVGSAFCGTLDRGGMQERYNGATKDMLRVPGVVGSYEQDALSLLQQSGLAVKIKRVTKDLPKYAGQEGMVIGQEPFSGGLAMLGSTVTITIYKKQKNERYDDGYSSGYPEPPTETWGSEPPYDGGTAGDTWGSEPPYDESTPGGSADDGWGSEPTYEGSPATPDTSSGDGLPSDSSSDGWGSSPTPEERTPATPPTKGAEVTPPAPTTGRSTAPGTPGASSVGRSGITGAAGKALGYNAISAQQLREMTDRSQKVSDLKRQMAAAERANQERMRELTNEAYLSGADCDDTDPEVYPGRVEICDHKDNDCDGVIDEDVGSYKFADVDGDGYGDPETMMKVCPADVEEALRGGHWLADTGNDCDDHDARHWNDCAPAAGH